VAREEEHIVKLKIDTTLRGTLAIQYKLLRLLKDAQDERSFINSLLAIGLIQISKTLLFDLFKTKKVSHNIFKNLFGGK